MRTAIYGAAVLVAAAFATPLSAQSSADERLGELADAFYAYRLEQFGLTETANGATEHAAHLPSVTAAAHRERARRYADFLARLDAIDRAKLTENARTNALVLRTLLEAEIGDARFAEWEMPFDSDSNFWGYLAERSALDSVGEYDRYIAWLNDLPRYFSEQEANARAGLARGFSVPRVTLTGRDASL
ncbi:MAG: DUF885 family protein, partial [Pseudomonadota bacterium]|nr:DUF885 family protein [Pseudomonadota bacterium]